MPFKVIEKLEDAEDFECYPAMMKPVDSQGQRGVHKVESFEEIKENFEKSMLYSKSGKIILESYLEGRGDFCKYICKKWKSNICSCIRSRFRLK